MKPFSLAGLFGFALLLSGCGDEPPPAPPVAVTVASTRSSLLALMPSPP